MRYTKNSYVCIMYSPWTLSGFLTPTVVGGRRPMPPEICAQSNATPIDDFDQHPIILPGPQPWELVKNVQLVLIRKSTTRFPTSHRWTVYVTPKSSKWWHKTRFCCFCQQNLTYVETSLLKSFFVWKLPEAKLYLHHVASTMLLVWTGL